ncbi:MAG: asparagine synthase (glutamine-hydrolyzing) [Acidobacteria bacterium RIFCSPLOWO2_02_FULL_64_15]|nr:MAG: asparagine synthase (glutamine-hydrolyzing) [Acidobacteria bacterium RIFCSPLOWO2_02_FULL_64_15]
MCGISGVATFRDEGIPKDAIRRLTDALRHRGPDDEGFFEERRGRAALGHRRLSIIDLASGHQPVYNEDRSVAIVFNGEIYNYLELRTGLEKKGHFFSTHSDTEAIVHLYEEFGPDCVHRLRGMFAFAIWDDRRSELFLARDRVGKKPTYYALVGGTLYFASEIQALYQVLEIPRQLDYEAIDLYLTYSCIPSPHSIYKSIRKLPPAHHLVFSAGGVALTRYWRPEYQPKTTLSYEDARSELNRILTDAVKLRIISDVPLGAFLSGGVDSSAIVAVMSRLSDRPVKTFSIGFPDQDYNELPYARQVARQYHTEHHEFVVEPDKLDILSDVVRHYGEPYGDSSAIPTWHLSRLTRQHVTVALNGDGGDELFGGYPWYRVIHDFHRAANPLVRRLARALGPVRGALPRRVRRAVELFGYDDARRFQSLRSYIEADDRARLFHDDFRRQLAVGAEAYLCSLYDKSLASDYDRSFRTDFLSYLPEDLLVKVDRASMAHGLECRSPFLDQELVEFSCRLPPDWKIDGARSKRILKETVADWFPKGFVDRRKMGFSVPIGNWFRGELKTFIRDKLMNGPLLRIPLVQAGGLENLLGEHFRGVRNHETQIWNLLMLSLWFEEFGAEP